MRLLKYHSPFRKHSSVIYRLGWGFGVFLVSQQNLPDLPHEQIRLAVPSLCSASVECHLRPPSTPSPSPPSSSTPPPPAPYYSSTLLLIFFLLKVADCSKEAHPAEVVLWCHRGCWSFHLPHPNNFSRCWSQSRKKKKRCSGCFQSNVAHNFHAWLRKWDSTSKKVGLQ